MRLVLALIATTACKGSDRPPLRQGCLPLPGAQRRNLRLDPDGTALWWIETVHARDYDGDTASFNRLVRYDLEKRHGTPIKDGVVGPFHFMRDGVLVAQSGTPSLVLVADSVQAVVPDYLTVRDVEPIDATRAAVLVDGDQRRAIYILELGNPRPYFLADANVLLSATRDHVFARTADGGESIELATGKRTAHVYPDGIPDDGMLWFVDGNRLRVLDMSTDEDRAVDADQQDWKLLYQDTSVLARTGPATGASYAYLLDDGKATKLATLGDGTSIVGAVRAGSKTWALVGHNTSNYDGDLFTVAHDSDVCDLALLPKHLAARKIPTRYHDKEPALLAAWQRTPKTHLWQVLDMDDGPTVMLGTIDEDGGSDLAALRARARRMHEEVTSILDDREVRTSLEFRDGKHALYRWRRDRLRGRALAGIGDVLLSEQADYDAELSDHKAEFAAGQITCYGKLTSLRNVVLRDVEVRCIPGDRERVVKIASIAPKETVQFAQAFDGKADEFLDIEVYRGTQQLVVRDMIVEARTQKLYDFLVALHADTHLALQSHNTTKQFYVLFRAPSMDVEPLKTAKARIEGARELFAAGDYDLQIQVEVDRKYYDFDGEKLDLSE